MKRANEICMDKLYDYCTAYCPIFA